MDGQIWDTLLERITRQTRHIEKSDCLMWTGCKKTSKHCLYGIMNVKLPRKHKFSTIHTHRLRYMISIRSTNLPRNYDVSHLCHRSLCVNINHLSLEPHHVNNSRQRCPNTYPRRCLGHTGYPNCII